MTSATTERLYKRAIIDFRTWCTQHEVRQPASSEAIAVYLEFCRLTYGPSSVPVRASAIAKLYRQRGRAFDTKAGPIQVVLSTARAEMRQAVNASASPRQPGASR